MARPSVFVVRKLSYDATRITSCENPVRTLERLWRTGVFWVISQMLYRVKTPFLASDAAAGEKTDVFTGT